MRYYFDQKKNLTFINFLFMSQITTQTFPINKKALSLFRRLWRAGNASVLYSRPAVYYTRQRIREGFNEYKNVEDEIILNDLFERCK
jgi:hypothetical protein